MITKHSLVSSWPHDLQGTGQSQSANVIKSLSKIFAPHQHDEPCETRCDHDLQSQGHMATHCRRKYASDLLSAAERRGTL